jgi:hypothetical protein
MAISNHISKACAFFYRFSLKNEHKNVKILTTDLWLYAFRKAASVSVEKEKVLVHRQRLQQPLDPCLCCCLFLRIQREGERERRDGGRDREFQFACA